MNREGIIRMARALGWSDKDINSLMYIIETAAASEREACAKVCEDFYQGLPPKLTVRGYLEDMAKAIRARGQA